MAHDDDAPRPDGGDRYAIYAVSRDGKSRRRIGETTLQGIGLCILTLVEEGEFEEGDRTGIFDRETREWLINPWTGSGLSHA